jgi:hypothetical protein
MWCVRNRSSRLSSPPIFSDSNHFFLWITELLSQWVQRAYDDFGTISSCAQHSDSGDLDRRGNAWWSVQNQRNASEWPNQSSKDARILQIQWSELLLQPNPPNEHSRQYRRLWILFSTNVCGDTPSAADSHSRYGKQRCLISLFR